MIIGVTDCSKYANYANWVLAYAPDVQVKKLTWRPSNLKEIKSCDGVVLTGGEDVHPRFYGRPDFYEYCYKDDVSEARDEFEWKVLEYTEANHIPVLGICRGLQIANAFFGGTLIPDISTWGKYNHSKMPDDSDRYHQVTVDPASWLYSIIGEEKGSVNSNHHQSADQVGKGLVVSAFSPEGVIEAIERKDAAAGAFLCLVQWHPERMKDQNSNFVKNIRKAFVEECRKKV
ncbi:MAG: gamma-glutamyl-gamma-aminobutyrate hydrolase family protein [Agriterribacter sp.]